jgi:hypothetical protein
MNSELCKVDGSHCDQFVVSSLMKYQTQTLTLSIEGALPEIGLTTVNNHNRHTRLHGKVWALK